MGVQPVWRWSRMLLLTGSVAAVVLLGGGELQPAWGEPAGPSSDDLEACLEERPPDVDVMQWGCVSTDGVTWHGQQTGSGAGSGFGTFVLIALLWSAVPLAIAASMASSRGESVGAAVALTLVLGWVGLAIVWFGQGRTRDTIHRVSTSAASGDHRSATRSAAATRPRSPAERLEELERLRAQDLITDDEYADRRQRILESL